MRISAHRAGVFVRLAVLVAACISMEGRARPGEIRVMTSGAFTAAYLDLAPQFERATGNKLVTLATSIGAGRNSIPNRIRNGEIVDVVIVADAVFRELMREGAVLPGSRVPVARSGIGMCVRAGAKKPDIRSVDALRQTLLAAKSIAYSNSVSGQYLTRELFPRLGVAEQVRAKCRQIELERVGAVVARGEAEIGFQQISELRPVQGIEYVGPLPAEAQRVTVFAAGIAAKSGNRGAARDFIRYVTSARAAPFIVKSGLEAGRVR
ncbi:MAG: substrate-binding domain-containing protein [Bryobacterales bacterium]|nr:substrate-binding domain-containing protein [Bryobacterales bacterium]